MQITLVSCVCLVSEVEIGLASWGQPLDKIEGLQTLSGSDAGRTVHSS